MTIFALELDTRFKIKFLYEFYFIKMTLTLIELRKKMDYLDLKKAQKSYLEGQNIMEFLRKEFKDWLNEIWHKKDKLINENKF